MNTVRHLSEKRASTTYLSYTEIAALLWRGHVVESPEYPLVFDKNDSSWFLFFDDILYRVFKNQAGTWKRKKVLIAWYPIENIQEGVMSNSGKPIQPVLRRGVWTYCDANLNIVKVFKKADGSVLIIEDEIERVKKESSDTTRRVAYLLDSRDK